MTTDLLSTFPLTRDYVGALQAVWRYMQNKEDTTQAFKFFDAMCGPRTEKNFARYTASPDGRARIAEQSDLVAILSDTARLEALPADTLGAAYLQFMRNEGLSAKGLVDIEVAAGIRALRLEPARRQFLTTGFQLHDMYHVLMGYGRDFVGEGCNLAFTAAQLRLSSVRDLSYIIGCKEKMVYPHLPVFACIREAARLGRNAVWTLDRDWSKLLAMPLPDVRAALGIDLPEIYHRHKATFSQVDAYRREKLAPAVAA